MLATGQVLAGQADVGPKWGRWQQMARRWAAPSTQAPSSPQCQPPNFSLFFPSLQLIFTMGEKKSDAISLHFTLKQVTPAPSKKHPTDGSGPLCSEKQQTSWAIGKLLKSHASCRGKGFKLLCSEQHRSEESESRFGFWLYDSKRKQVT